MNGRSFSTWYTGGNLNSLCIRSFALWRIKSCAWPLISVTEWCLPTWTKHGSRFTAGCRTRPCARREETCSVWRIGMSANGQEVLLPRRKDSATLRTRYMEFCWYGVKAKATATSLQKEQIYCYLNVEKVSQRWLLPEPDNDIIMSRHLKGGEFSKILRQKNQKQSPWWL